MKNSIKITLRCSCVFETAPLFAFYLSLFLPLSLSLSPSLPLPLPLPLQWSFTCFSESTNHGVCFSSWEIYAIILPILILLTYLPSFRLLAYAAYIGSVFLAIAMVVSISSIYKDHIFVQEIAGLRACTYLP